MSINKKIFATPKTRKFARELGANISEIPGTERAGRITNEDVKNYINNKLNNQKIDSENSKDKINLKVEFDHSDFGEVEVIDMPRINCAFQFSLRSIIAGKAAKKGANAPIAEVIAGPTFVMEKA